MGRAGYSGVKLANKIGWTQPYFSRRMSGKMAFDVDDLEKIANALDVPMWRLVTSMPASTQPPEGGNSQWALRGSNPQPTDYKVEASVIDMSAWRGAKLSKSA